MAKYLKFGTYSDDRIDYSVPINLARQDVWPFHPVDVPRLIDMKRLESFSFLSGFMPLLTFDIYKLIYTHFSNVK